MHLKNASIKVKILYSSLFITLLPLLLLELLFFISTQRSVMRQLAASARVRADQLQTGLENETGKMERMAKMLADFTPLSVYLQSDFLNAGDEFNYYQKNIHSMLRGCNQTFDGVKVRIYHNHDIHNFSFELNNGLDRFLGCLQAEDAPDAGAGFWKHVDIRYNTYQSAYTYFYMVRERNWPYHISYLITVHMDQTALLSHISFESTETGLIYILDQEGNLLATNDMESSALPNFPLLLSVQDDTHVNIRGKDFYAVCRQNDGIRIVYLLPWNSMYKEVFHSMLILILAGLFLLTISGVLSLQTSTHILRGIEGLTEKMQNVDRIRIQEMAIANVDQTSRDEIVRLDAVFTKMMIQIDNLVTMVQEKEQHLKDEIIARQQAEICVLQHQINPHYLFNTLEAIRMNLVIKDDWENAEIVRLFADSFRRYIDMHEEDTTLLEEIDFIKKYIRIQNYRLDNRIVFTCEMDDALQGCHIVKLLLQPLVENAVCHGVEEKAGKGHIRLRIFYEAGWMQLIVEDDGIGMSGEQLEKLRQRIFGMQSGTAVGLQNVWQRIHLIYGERAEMSIISTLGEGTIVKLFIPYLK